MDQFKSTLDMKHDEGWIHALAPQTSLLCSSRFQFQPPSDLSSLPHGVQYLSVELGDDSVVVGVNAGPQQSVSFLVQAAQVLVSVERGGGVRLRGGGAYSVLLLLQSETKTLITRNK